MQLCAKADLFQCLCRPTSPLAAGDTGNRHRQLHICEHGLVRDQVIALEHKADRMVPVGIPVPVLIFFRRNTIDDQIAAVITVQSPDDVQQRRLSRTARPENRHEFIVAQIQADVIKRLLNQLPCAVFLPDMLNLKHSFSPISSIN